MYTNLHELFEKSRNYPLKKQVEDFLQKSPLDLDAVFKQAKKLTLQEASQKPPHYKGRNFMAESMYGNVIGILKDNYPDYMKVDTHNRAYISLADNIRVYIKKLTEAHLPSNIKTKNVTQMNAQELFEEDGQIHIVYAGFVLDDNDWVLDFKEACISYLNKVFYDSAAWLIDLTLDPFKKSVPIISYLDAHFINDEQLVSVPRNKEGDTGTSGK